MLIRIKATGQVIDMIPAVAVAKLNAGMAEVIDVKGRETAAKLFPTSIGGFFEKAARFIGGR